MTTTSTTTDFDLTTDDQGRLVLARPGHDDATDVRVRRVFPWSEPHRFVSIRSSEGKELLLIDDLAALPASARDAIERQLAATQFIPKVTRIREVDTRFGHQLWDVDTDRGPAKFRVQEREDVRFLDDGRLRVKDADGNVYELPALDTLDEASRRAIEPLF